MKFKPTRTATQPTLNFIKLSKNIRVSNYTCGINLYVKIFFISSALKATAKGENK